LSIYLRFAPKWYDLSAVIAFEFDETKGKKNLLKTGINFVGAQLLWNDPSLPV
jgi:hypothetical protein